MVIIPSVTKRIVGEVNRLVFLSEHGETDVEPAGIVVVITISVVLLSLQLTVVVGGEVNNPPFRTK